MPVLMAMTDSEDLLCRGNSKLDSFLKRNTDRDVFERIRAYEPCVVISEKVNKVFMHVVLSDDCIYLTEYPPRTVQEAVCFRDIIDIELINDLPDFLSGRERERSQHIRVVYAAAKHAGKRGERGPGGGRPGKSRSPATPDRRPTWSAAPSLEGISGVLLSTHSAPPETVGWRISLSSLRGSREEGEEERALRSRSASCPNPDALGLGPPRPLPWPPSSAPSASAPLGTSAPDGEEEEEEREEALHLYAVSLASRIYLHLQSSWNSYIIRSTLMLDPLYMRRCSVLSPSSPQKPHQMSWERTSHLFGQLSGELLQEGISLERRYLLLQELRAATHRNGTIKKLFWKSSDLCPFLVKMLDDTLQSPQTGVHMADRLLLCTLVAQILSLMFRETEIEPARLSMLTAKRGALTTRLLQAVVCDPELHPPDPPASPSGSPGSGRRSPSHAELQGLQAEYLDAAAALMFEVLVLCQEASRAPTLEHLLTVGWVLTTLTPHPSLLTFVGYQARRVVAVLSGSQPPLSPSQAVLLYQRCRVLLACLQYSARLSLYIRTEFKEEFRYYVRMSGLEDKLPSQYPISQPALRLLSQLLSLVLQRT